MASAARGPSPQLCAAAAPNGSCKYWMSADNHAGGNATELRFDARNALIVSKNHKLPDVVQPGDRERFFSIGCIDEATMRARCPVFTMCVHTADNIASYGAPGLLSSPSTQLASTMARVAAIPIRSIASSTRNTDPKPDAQKAPLACFSNPCTNEGLVPNVIANCERLDEGLLHMAMAHGPRQAAAG